jgi:hypothetical protein
MGYSKLVKMYGLDDHGRSASMWGFIPEVDKQRLKDMGLTAKLMPFVQKLVEYENRSIVNGKFETWACVRETVLAEKLGVCEKTIRNYVREVSEKGIFKVFRQRDPQSHKNLTNRYKIVDEIKNILSRATVIFLKAWGLWKKPEVNQFREITVPVKGITGGAFSARRVEKMVSDIGRIQENSSDAFSSAQKKTFMSELYDLVNHLDTKKTWSSDEYYLFDCLEEIEYRKLA